VQRGKAIKEGGKKMGKLQYLGVIVGVVKK